MIATGLMMVMVAAANNVDLMKLVYLFVRMMSREAVVVVVFVVLEVGAGRPQTCTVSHYFRLRSEMVHLRKLL